MMTSDKEALLSQQKLKSLLQYDPSSGNFVWLISTGRVKYGSPAGRKASHGYREIRIDKRFYLNHRLAWLYITGDWPAGEIDHIDRDRSNNQWTNLRLASKQQNQANTIQRLNNKTGFKGVYRADKKFAAKVGGIYLGRFDTPEEAYEVYLLKAREMWGEYSRGNGTN
jgi:hypothetical protein